MTGSELVQLVESGAEIWLELYSAETRAAHTTSRVLIIGASVDRLGLLVDLTDGEYRWSLWRPIRMSTRVRVGGRTGRIESVVYASY
jgi:hypothetical protein